MKLLKKISLFIILIITLLTLIKINTVSRNVYSSTTSAGRRTKIGVLFFKLDDPYMSLVK